MELARDFLFGNKRASMNSHGGNLKNLSKRAGCSADEILDFSANINPLGAPDYLRSIISRTIDIVGRYPDPDNTELIQAISHGMNVPAARIVAGNGSSELFYALPGALCCKTAVIPVPSYADYGRAAAARGCAVKTICTKLDHDAVVNLDEISAQLTGGEAVFIGQPNNPTGTLTDRAELLTLAQTHPDSWFIVDESFADFVPDYRSLALDLTDNMIVVKSLTKIYAIPGLRLGYLVANEKTAALIEKLLPPWRINVIAQTLGTKFLKDHTYITETQRTIADLRARLGAALGNIPGFFVFRGAANFLLVRIDRDGLNSRMLEEKLLQHRIAIRVFDGSDNLDERYFRVAVRTEEENRRLIEAVTAIVQQRAKKYVQRKKPAIMFQGTGSNVGKSVLTAAFCRILTQDGLRVAPFKAQNMSLNSCVTASGGEMGRAQVVQAQACRIDPDVRMNPILLKPCSDTGSQVIVRGKPVGNMSVGEYIRYKPKAFEVAKQCFDSLCRDYDAVVLEGAGSPGEVNLKHHDIVNMSMAKYAEAPVLLVGDIDPGGIFASFTGTMEVLNPEERKMIKGFIINRFRGKQALLADALDYMAERTGKPVLGVVPYFKNIGLPEEDSVEFKSETTGGYETDGKPIAIAFIDLPHVSNFTDMDALRIEPDVSLRIVRSVNDLTAPDLVIIPGSKNVISDMHYLTTSGLAKKITEIALSASADVVGICGGFQLLGSKIHDPNGIESAVDSIAGLGLLEMETVLAENKILAKTQGIHRQSGLPVHGYEIHHGRSKGVGTVPVIQSVNGEELGAGTPDFRIWGTYLHGVFDSDEFRRWTINRLRIRKGLPVLTGSGYVYSIEPALDSLAQTVRETIQMDKIYSLIGL
jgi:adenosylcobyric acid synthase